MSEFFKWLSARMGSVKDFDENKEQLLTGIERGFLMNIMKGDGPPSLSCTNDADCKKYDNELMCRRIKTKDSAGGLRASGSHSDEDRVIYEVENAYENECVSPKGHKFVAKDIHLRAAYPELFGIVAPDINLRAAYPDLFGIVAPDINLRAADPLLEYGGGRRKKSYTKKKSKRKVSKHKKSKNRSKQARKTRRKKRRKTKKKNTFN